MKNAAATPPFTVRMVERVIHLSRIKRIMLAALFALALTLLVTPVIDRLYLTYFDDPATRGLPAMVSTALGLVAYIVGWRLIIGYAGEAPPPRRAILWYVIGGAAACALVAILVIVGAISGTME